MTTGNAENDAVLAAQLDRAVALLTSGQATTERDLIAQGVDKATAIAAMEGYGQSEPEPEPSPEPAQAAPASERERPAPFAGQSQEAHPVERAASALEQIASALDPSQDDQFVVKVLDATAPEGQHRQLLVEGDEQAQAVAEAVTCWTGWEIGMAPLSAFNGEGGEIFVFEPLGEGEVKVRIEQIPADDPVEEDAPSYFEDGVLIIRTGQEQEAIQELAKEAAEGDESARKILEAFREAVPPEVKA